MIKRNNRIQNNHFTVTPVKHTERMDKNLDKKTDYYQSNHQKMIQYFQNGCKDRANKLQFGLELEHFLIQNKDGKSVPFSGPKGVEKILEGLFLFYPKRYESEGHLIGVGNGVITISIEPAAQLEISVVPQTDFFYLKEIYQQFRAAIDPILEQLGCHLATMGYQPYSTADSLQLIPKLRYEYMNRYFEKIGPYGKQMMRATASTQFSIDYYSEKDFSLKYRLAHELLPIFGALSENTPYYEGKKFKGHGLRQKIWDKTDPARVLIEPFMKNETIDFVSYTEFVMQAPVIVQEYQERDTYCEDTIRKQCEKFEFSTDEIAHLLSMVFPMIRLKQYLEIRIADSMPIDAVCCYGILLKGLFSDPQDSLNVLNEVKESGAFKREGILSLLTIICKHISIEEASYIETFQKEMQHGTIIKSDPETL